MQATVLTIAGSDPTGGAGLQADLKTMTAIGVYAAAVVTCITVQNSRGVKRTCPLEPDLVAEQIRAVLEDHHVTHVKIGMIGNAAVAEAISSQLEDFGGEVVIDPVLLSTTGQELLQSSDLAAVRSGLMQKATVMTPNLPELAALMGVRIEDPEGTLQAADRLLHQLPGLRAVVVKGGHLISNREVTDIFLYRTSGVIKLATSTRPFIDSRNTHGTGCALASAYAAYHSLTGDDEQAFYSSTNFIQQMLAKSRGREIVRNPDGFGGLIYGPPEED